jgi:hypothetical protein
MLCFNAICKDNYAVICISVDHKTPSLSSSFIDHSVLVYFITARMILEAVPFSVRRGVICMMLELRLLYCRMRIRTECSGD